MKLQLLQLLPAIFLFGVDIDARAQTPASTAPSPAPANGFSVLYNWLIQDLSLSGSGAAMVRGGEWEAGRELWTVSISSGKESRLYAADDSLWTPTAVTGNTIAFVQADGIWTVDAGTQQASLKIPAKNITAILRAINDHVVLVAMPDAPGSVRMAIEQADFSAGAITKSTDAPSGSIDKTELTELLKLRGLRNKTLVVAFEGALKLQDIKTGSQSPVTAHLDATETRYDRSAPSWLNDDVVIYVASPHNL